MSRVGVMYLHFCSTVVQSLQMRKCGLLCCKMNSVSFTCTSDNNYENECSLIQYLMSQYVQSAFEEFSTMGSPSEDNFESRTYINWIFSPIIKQKYFTFFLVAPQTFLNINLCGFSFRYPCDLGNSLLKFVPCACNVSVTICKRGEYFIL